jgi:hypothetical protein
LHISGADALAAPWDGQVCVCHGVSDSQELCDDAAECLDDEVQGQQRVEDLPTHNTHGSTLIIIIIIIFIKSSLRVYVSSSGESPNPSSPIPTAQTRSFTIGHDMTKTPIPHAT